MSCLSLNSSARSWGHSASPSQSSGYSTAPTTPGMSSPNHSSGKSIARVRTTDSGVDQPSVSSPFLLAARLTRSRASTLSRSPEVITSVQEDYFSPLSDQICEQPPAEAPEKKPIDFWGKLAPELRVKILGYLAPKEIIRSSIVSKGWHSICFDGQLWTALDASMYYRDIPAETLARIITSAGPFIKDLNLRGCVQVYQDWRRNKMSDACSNLANVSLEGCSIDRTSLHYLLLRNTRLSQLNLSGLKAVSNSTCRIIAQACPALESLNISWCSNLDTRGVRRVIEACPALLDLRVGEMRGWEEKEAMLAIHNHNKLERLVMSGCETLTDDVLSVLCQGMELQLDPFTDRTTAPARSLKYLDLSRCNQLSDRGIKTLAYNLPHLNGLRLSGCNLLTDAGVADLLYSVPLLTHLDLEELTALTNMTPQNIARSPCSVSLEHISFGYCESFADVGMLPLIRACTSLQSLEIDNTAISNAFLTEAAAVVRLRPVGDKRIAKDGKAKIGLRLAAYDCANVTWIGVREVLSRNAETISPNIIARTFISAARRPSALPSQVIHLKCFYGWQMMIDEHMKRVLRGDLDGANSLERKWADYMIANEEAGTEGRGASRRRRRARAAEIMAAHDLDDPLAAVSLASARRRRTTRGPASVSCTIM